MLGHPLAQVLLLVGAIALVMAVMAVIGHPLRVLFEWLEEHTRFREEHYYGALLALCIGGPVVAAIVAAALA